MKKLLKNNIVVHEFSVLTIFWLYSCNNFAFLNNSGRSYSKYHHFFLSLLYYHFNSLTFLLSPQHSQFPLYLLIVHFFFFPLLVEKTCNTSFFVKSIYSSYLFIKFFVSFKFLSNHPKSTTRGGNFYPNP